MKKAKLKKLTPVESMLLAKNKLIERLRDEISLIRVQANRDVAKVEIRIRVAETLRDALKSGKLRFL